jgi:hypothetical protein
MVLPGSVVPDLLGLAAFREATASVFVLVDAMMRAIDRRPLRKRHCAGQQNGVPANLTVI